jgi:cellulose synthase/poly-beta-1,6-N-acetylglucosamine synthase-like glycosyltransferase
MNSVLTIVQYGLFVFFALQVSYLLIFSIFSLLKYRPKLKEGREHTFAVLIPGYKEDQIIIDTAKVALEQDYPKEKFRVLVLADQFKKSTVEEIRKLGAEVLEVQFENSTKAKSLNEGLKYFADSAPEAVVILDADNLMMQGVLRQFSQAMHAGFQVVQGHRTAKNTQTPFATLDAANEEVGNSIFRKGHRKLGLPSALIGSGMCFDFKLFVDLMADILDVSGEDKLLELKLMDQGYNIEYLPDALILDEKVANSGNFSKQRTRWVGVQLHYLRHYFFKGLLHFLKTGNLSYFDKVVQFALVSKVLMMGLLISLGIADVFLHFQAPWDLLGLGMAMAMLLAVPRRMYNRKLLLAIFQLPGAFFGMIKAIARIDRNTASKFEVTEKTVTSEKH